MFKSSILVLSGSFVLAAACSGGPSNPKDACNDAISQYCSKLYQCVDAATIQTFFGFSSQDDCVIKAGAQANCVNLACQPGTTFDSSAASACENDIKNAQCSNQFDVPASCTPSAWCK